MQQSPPRPLRDLTGPVSTGVATAFRALLGSRGVDGQCLVSTLLLPEAQEGGVSGAEGLAGTPILPTLHPHHQRGDPADNSAGAWTPPGSQGPRVQRGSSRRPGAAKQSTTSCAASLRQEKCILSQLWGPEV